MSITRKIQFSSIPLLVLSHSATIIFGLCVVIAIPARAQVLESAYFEALGVITPGGEFGRAVAPIGDIDSDGNIDVAIGVPLDDSAGEDWGSVLIVFLDGDGLVKAYQKINALEGGFVAPRQEYQFGIKLTAVGDYDSDGVNDLAASSSAAGWILLLSRDGTVKRQLLLPHSSQLNRIPARGAAVALVGDIDGNGIMEVAHSRSGNNATGVFELAFLASQGGDSIHSSIMIGSGIGGFPDILEGGDRFATSLDAIGDLDGDGIDELVVGAPGTNDVNAESGAVYVLFLQPGSGKVRRFTKISNSENSPSALLSEGAHFGRHVRSLGDLNRDGLEEVAVSGNDSTGGAIWILQLTENGELSAVHVIGSTDSLFELDLDADSRFARGFGVEDWDGDGLPDIFVGSPGAGEVRIVDDLGRLPSRVTSLTVVPEIPRRGQGAFFLITTDGIGAVQSASLSFREGGEDRFVDQQMAKITDGVYFGSVSGEVTGDSGLEYRFELTNGSGLATTLPTEGLHALSVRLEQGLDLAISGGEESADYRLVSFPLSLDDSTGAFLEASLGVYDSTQWRFFSQGENDRLQEFGSGNVRIEPGRSYWVLTRDDVVANSGPGATNPSDRAFSVPVEAGWTLVANPFNFDIPVANLQFQSDEPIDLRKFTGTWSEEVASIDPFEGYAIFSEDGDILVIDPGVRNPGPRSVSTKQGNGSFDWSLHIVASSGRARDADNVLAVAVGARDGWDARDRPEPPVIGDYVSVYLPHPEWQRTTERFNVDVRDLDGEPKRWTIAIEAPKPKAVHLQFDGLEKVPAGLDIWMIDSLTGVRQDLRTDPTYRLVSGTPDRMRTIEVFVGSYQLPTDVQPTLESLTIEVFPNPAVGVITINVESLEATPLQLTIFDVNGREVASFLDHSKRGRDRVSFVWDGRTDDGTPVAPGLYLVGVRADAVSRFTGVILTR